MEKNKVKSIEVILKTVERCNIDCTYCYFFNGGDMSYEKHLPYIKLKTVEEIATFLEKGVKELQIERVQIDLHGGEPMMQSIEDFDSTYRIFKDKLSPITKFFSNTDKCYVSE